MTDQIRLTAAQERLLREIAKRDTGAGVYFAYEGGSIFHLPGTDYRVARRTFFPLTGWHSLIDDPGGDSPVRITDAGRAHLAALDAAKASKPKRTPAA